MPSTTWRALAMYCRASWSNVNAVPTKGPYLMQRTRRRTLFVRIIVSLSCVALPFTLPLLLTPPLCRIIQSLFLFPPISHSRGGARRTPGAHKLNVNVPLVSFRINPGNIRRR